MSKSKYEAKIDFLVCSNRTFELRALDIMNIGKIKKFPILLKFSMFIEVNLTNKDK